MHSQLLISHTHRFMRSFYSKREPNSHLRGTNFEPALNSDNAWTSLRKQIIHLSYMSFMNTNLLTQWTSFKIRNFKSSDSPMISWIDPKILLEMLVKNIHITISRIKLIYFFNDVTTVLVLVFGFHYCSLGFTFIHLFIPSRSPTGPLGFSANQRKEEAGEMLLSSRIAQPVIELSWLHFLSTNWCSFELTWTMAFWPLHVINYWTFLPNNSAPHPYQGDLALRIALVTFLSRVPTDALISMNWFGMI